ncbi:MAG: ABC-F family ATP-binding cassette domain-containing protein [Candidatus Rokubacteria bacterium]|nr:ABC-F family ATP-binding cassette domain-containing protein [Candidatus Rokubacteria bacterium]
MIQLDGVSKTYGGQTLFRDLSWRIGDGERIGLVGPNGVGKTTLCRILAGQETPDSGAVSRPRTTTVGYLPQDAGGAVPHTVTEPVNQAGDRGAPRLGRGAPSAGGLGGFDGPPMITVLGEALSGFDEVWQLERELEVVATALAGAPDEALTARYGELQQRFDALGGYRLETGARLILGGLGFAPAEVTRPLAEFSGGWRMRAALARLLLLRPSLLLLDEPTNHLDLDSLGWLESFLERYDGTVVVVSHDRYFLNRMVTSIADLGPGGVSVYAGDYDDFLVERETRRQLLEAQAANQAKRVAEIERFVERFRYKATKARQVQSRLKMLERMERVEVPEAQRRIRFAFPEAPRTGRRVLTLRGLHKAYGDRVVYAGVDFEVERGETVALVGPNGAGKSTLLRVLAGTLPFERGERTLGLGVTIHYYAQHQLEALDPSRTVYEEMERAAPELGRTRLRTILGSFLFSGDSVDKRVAVLSGGEKARLALARMLVRPAALLALDEPTNHLDLASREVLEDALADFGGTIVFISHDRYFINRIASRVVEIEDGRLTSYPGTYDDYRDARARLAAPDTASQDPAGTDDTGVAWRRRAAEPAADARRAHGSPTPRERRRSAAEVRRLRVRLDAVERRITELEARLDEISGMLAEPELYRDGDRARAVLAERKSAESDLAGLMSEWEELAGALADDA